MQDYGVWTRYEMPEPVLTLFGTVPFYKNSQGKDFYVERKKWPAGKTWASVDTDGKVIVAFNDATMIDPAMGRIVALDQVADPKTLWGQKVI